MCSPCCTTCNLACQGERIAHGQRVPIVVHDGMILDGVHRARACARLGIMPRTVEWEANGSPVDFVWSMNGPRRHLNASQRAMVAAKIANLKQGRPPQDGKETNLSLNRTRIRAAAKLVNVGEMSVKHARSVLTGGTAAEIAMVAAKIANIKHGGDRKSDQETNLSLDRVRVRAAAKLVNISEKSVTRSRCPCAS